MLPVARMFAQPTFVALIAPVVMLGALIGTLTAAGVPDNKTEAILIEKKKKTRQSRVFNPGPRTLFCVAKQRKKTRHDPKKPKGPSKN